VLAELHLMSTRLNGFIGETEKYGDVYLGDITVKSDIRVLSPAEDPADAFIFASAPKVLDKSIVASNGTKAKAAEEARETPEERAQNKLLTALRSAEDTGFACLSRTWLAVVARISPNSSDYRKHVSRLEQAGFIAYPVPGEISLTPAGREVANRLPHRRFTQADLLSSFEKLFKPARYRIMLALADAKRGNQWVTREQLAEASEQSVNSSAYREHMSALRELGLIELAQVPGQVRADPFLFLPQVVAR
jgi:DNA-binding transcriptional ArsR family regulator